MLRITTLVENRDGEHHGLRSEHGLSLYVEKGEVRFLFDTGQSDALIHNAVQLGVDLGAVDFVVLSHGHYDHTGGFRHLAERFFIPQLFVGPGFFEEKYALRGRACDFLGNSFDETFLKKKTIPWTVISEPIREIAPDIFLLSGFPRLHEDETIPQRFVLRREGTFEQDSFADEIALVIRTAQGSVVLLGCSHPGMRNMLDAVQERLDAPIRAVLGGTHLVEAHGKRLEESLEYLQLLNSRGAVVSISHCTGKEVLEDAQLRDSLLTWNGTGSSIFLE
ncbi:MAG: MBL fold metallo-hydrolase [Fretibacterium sp.]|nr:MBL fold metallo-hydrolase [Fretibacterium sp.]